MNICRLIIYKQTLTGHSWKSGLLFGREGASESSSCYCSVSLFSHHQEVFYSSVPLMWFCYWERSKESFLWSPRPHHGIVYITSYIYSKCIKHMIGLIFSVFTAILSANVKTHLKSCHCIMCFYSASKVTYNLTNKKKNKWINKNDQWVYRKIINDPPPTTRNKNTNKKNYSIKKWPQTLQHINVAIALNSCCVHNKLLETPGTASQPAGREPCRHNNHYHVVVTAALVSCLCIQYSLYYCQKPLSWSDA